MLDETQVNTIENGLIFHLKTGIGRWKIMTLEKHAPGFPTSQNSLRRQCNNI